MSKFKKIPFLAIVTDITSHYSKINKEDYLVKGNYKVIDQGQNFIGGYTDNKELVTEKEFPVIVFGDHTKIFKYVDFPFAIGADGVKVLMVNQQLAYTLYVYFFFKTIHLPESGYSRHFKYLKDIKIPIPENYSDQIRIATVLNKVEELIKQRNESITVLEELLISIFLQMFGNPIRNEKGWEKVRLGDKCIKIGSGATPRGGKERYKSEGISLIRSLNVHNNQFKYENLAFIDEEQAALLDNVIVEQRDILLNITGASVARCCIVPDNVLPARVNQHVSIIRPEKEIFNPFFLNRLFTTPSFQKFLITNAKKKGATREAITKEEIESLKLPKPPIDLQNQFAQFVEKVESLNELYNNSLHELENLYAALSQLAFNGELMLSKLDVVHRIPKESESIDEINRQKISLKDGYFEITNDQEIFEIFAKEREEFIKSLLSSKNQKDIEEKLLIFDQRLNEGREIPFWKEYVKYRIIKNKFATSFSFEELWNELTKIAFDEPLNYEQLRQTVFDWLREDKPFLKQIFNTEKEKREIQFIVNETT